MEGYIPANDLTFANPDCCGDMGGYRRATLIFELI